MNIAIIITSAIDAFFRPLLSNFSFISISSLPILTGLFLLNLSVNIVNNNANNNDAITIKNKLPL